MQAGFYRQVEPALAQFFVLPFEHSEDISDQDAGLALATELGDGES